MSTPPVPSWTLTARWVFPVDGPPLPRGTVTARGERIVAVESFGQRQPDVDLGNVAILPGFVNAHTHLDLSGLRGKYPPTPDFVGWLRQVIAHRHGTTSEETQANIRAGLAEAVRYGTTLLGDIASGGASWDLLAEAPLRAVVFYELLGLTVVRAAQALAGARVWLLGHSPTATCRPGLSPHAPYSVRASLFREVAAIRPALPVAIHLAETRAELALLASRTGPFLELLSGLGVWDPQGLVADTGQVLRLNSQSAPRLFVHGNYLGPRAPLSPGAALVYCPRTHAAFGHARHPFRAFLKKGVPVALGTDSLASNPDLNVLAEARFVHQQFSDTPGAHLLRMATLAGAEALGWEDETGSLTPGKSADLVVLPLPDEEPADPHKLILASSLPLRSVLFRGRWVVGREPSP